MKKRCLIRMELIIAIALAFPACKSGYEKYIDLLQDAQKGLTPYWIANPSDGPGTILQTVQGAELLVYSQPNAFPNIEIGKNPVPTFTSAKVSKIKIKGDISADLCKILNADVNASIGFSLNKETTVSLSVDGPELHRVELGKITEALKRFDIKDSHQNEIIQSLMRDDVILICGALHVRGFTFSFEKTSVLAASDESSLTNSLAQQNLEFNRTGQTNFTLQTKEPMYIAYYAYPVDKAVIKRIYEDIRAASTARQEVDEVARIEREVADIQSALADLPHLIAQKDDIRGMIGKLALEERDLNSRYERAPNAATKNAIRRELADNKQRMATYEGQLTRIDKIEKFDSLSKHSAQNLAVIEDFGEKQYSLFGPNPILSAKIISRK